MKKSIWKLLVIFFAISFLPGCVKLAFRFSPLLISNMSQAFFEECDTDLAKRSFPASLKLMEGLLKNDPHNKQLLTSLCMGFAGYAMLFVEENDPKRASQLYLRAREYGLKAVCRGKALFDLPRLKKEEIRNILLSLSEKDAAPLFWSALSWNAWIILNLDKPAAVAQISIAEACLKRVVEMRPDYFYGAPYVLMGSILSARPVILGGDAEKAKEYFEKAIHLTHGKFLLAHYCYARYYAVRKQDKSLFVKLVSEIDMARADELKETCLINAVMKQKAGRLIEMSEELFF